MRKAVARKVVVAFEPVTGEVPQWITDAKARRISPLAHAANPSRIASIAV
jgi:hypothetical protein